MTIRSKIWTIIRAVLILFLIVNLYALSLRFISVPGTLLMAQRSLSGQDIRKDWTPLSEMSPYIVQAVMAGEDSRFCEHDGIDFSAIKQAMSDNKTRARRRGGSTITQQTAKNVFFWNGGGLLRKAGEAWFASLIDFSWGKNRVMEVYLNVAEWGDGIFGVEAAAQARFGKPAKDLTKREAALLAAVLPSPNKWRLDPPTEFVSGRASTLQKRMSVIRQSHYAKCISGQKQEAIPTIEAEDDKTDINDAPSQAEKPVATNITPDEEEDDGIVIEPPLSLEEVLEKAENSLEKNEVIEPEEE